ncbi:diguanylate cyclase with PAS/PAC sensor [Denitrovibrio acetiphilus DSM 12809]|uniref:Diguanylate cyclase with PAS/PAC sensor n=1 Tax=Denitrovibrio acetiphilus (strain DSM 12809 / NBRC 114555 / N2460) TaxID=522772 RepID=D4H1W5_DENA2|nr:PAS domain S-box protein [Denitrovibrio acetiphilus]ADD66942.1 diguanylate cyclase with PAS/PAC sensor [Denitrovibrio acetiphilus DSM 12809]
MINKLSTKNKTLLFVTCMLIAFSVILIGIVYIDQKKKLEALEFNYYDNVKTIFSKLLERHQNFYKSRSKANISSFGVKQALAERDREKLYSLIAGRWHTLRSENPYLNIMNFHTPDGKCFLRMQRPDRYGDNSSDINSMIKRVHTEQKTISGFEAGKYSLSYRTVTPIFYNNQYIGALEIGSRPDIFLNDMNYMNGLRGALFVRKNLLNLYRENSGFEIGQFVLQYKTSNNRILLNNLKKRHYNFPAYLHMHTGGETIDIYSFDIHDLNSNVAAKAIFFHNITKAEMDFRNTLEKLGIILASLMTVILLIINFGFKKIIAALDNSNRKLRDNKKFLQLILDNTAHAVIATKKDGRITLFNRKAEQMLGYKKSDIVGISTPLIFHKPNESILSKNSNTFCDSSPAQIFETMITNILNEGAAGNEQTFMTKDGHEFPVSLHITKLEDDDGTLTGFIGIAEDISRKKLLENSLLQQKNELEAVFNTSMDGIAIMDLDTNFIFFNRTYEKLTGYSRKELFNLTCMKITAKENIQKSSKVLSHLTKHGHLDNFEKIYIKKNGEKVIVNMSFVMMPDRKRFLVTAKDITTVKQSEKQLKDHMELIDKHIISCTTDNEGRYTGVSDAFCRISGYTADELIGKSHRILRHSDINEYEMDTVLNQINSGGEWRGEIKNLSKNGRTYWVQSSVAPMFNSQGSISGYTSIAQDITDKKIIEQISITDGLTGIFNRRHFNDIYPKFINYAKRHNELTNFIILDLDNFKQYNDTYGHQKGDETLRKVAKCIAGTMQRADDTCFRLGGEEFGILYKTAGAKHAENIAERIRSNVEALAIPHETSDTSNVVTISIGLLSKYAGDIHCTNELYAQADKLLYRAKANGRNRVEHSAP